MGEIKSTLEIIMEKAKDLTISADEKEAFQKSETEKKVRRLLQRFIDGLIDLKTVKKEISILEGSPPATAMEVFASECLKRIFPDRENGTVLELLENVAGVDSSPIRRMLLQFHRDLEQKKEVLKEVLVERLRQEGVSGSAVIPNLEADPEWQQQVMETKKGFQGKMVELVRQRMR
jgi:hypothetical protein